MKQNRVGMAYWLDSSSQSLTNQHVYIHMKTNAKFSIPVEYTENREDGEQRWSDVD